VRPAPAEEISHAAYLRPKLAAVIGPRISVPESEPVPPVVATVGVVVEAESQEETTTRKSPVEMVQVILKLAALAVCSPFPTAWNVAVIS
jgi:hypothetical protein